MNMDMCCRIEGTEKIFLESALSVLIPGITERK